MDRNNIGPGEQIIKRDRGNPQGLAAFIIEHGIIADNIHAQSACAFGD